MSRNINDLVSSTFGLIMVMVMIVLWGNGYSVRPYHFLIVGAFQFGLAIGRLRK